MAQKQGIINSSENLEIKRLGVRMGFKAQMKDYLDRKKNTILTKICMKLKMAGAAEVGRIYIPGIGISILFHVFIFK